MVMISSSVIEDKTVCSVCWRGLNSDYVRFVDRMKSGERRWKLGSRIIEFLNKKAWYFLMKFVFSRFGRLTGLLKDLKSTLQTVQKAVYFNRCAGKLGIETP
jgi:hypothetical protein